MNATAQNGAPVTDADDSHYFGATVGINIEKATNGVDADLPPGPFITPGTLVTWTYVVTNTGNTPLAGVVVTDNQPGVTPVFQGGDTDSDGLLDVTETWTYTATDTSANVGQYANVGTAAAQGGVSDSDASHYFGAQPAIDIEKSTNGVDADAADGAQRPGGLSGHLDVRRHEHGEHPGLGRPGYGQRPGRGGHLRLLPRRHRPRAGREHDVHRQRPDRRSRPVREHRHRERHRGERGAGHGRRRLPLLRARTPHRHREGDERRRRRLAAGAVHHPGHPGHLDVRRYEHGEHSAGGRGRHGQPPGVTPVFQGGDTDGDGLLDLTETWTYTATDASADLGQYENVGTVAAQGGAVSDSDASHYFGAQPAVTIEKFTNLDPADVAPGPVLAVGSTVNWFYRVTNTGNVPLFNWQVTDSQQASRSAVLGPS